MIDVSNYYLVIIDEGFDDMSLISCQVILEESNHEVIICSHINGAIKGIDSSVISVSFDEVLSHDINYTGIIVLGGGTTNLPEKITTFIKSNQTAGKTIVGIDKGVNELKILFPEFNYSTDKQYVRDRNVITLFDPSEIEGFVEGIADNSI